MDRTHGGDFVGLVLFPFGALHFSSQIAHKSGSGKLDKQLFGY